MDWCLVSAYLHVSNRMAVRTIKQVQEGTTGDQVRNRQHVKLQGQEQIQIQVQVQEKVQEYESVQGQVQEQVQK